MISHSSGEDSSRDMLEKMNPDPNKALYYLWVNKDLFQTTITSYRQLLTVATLDD